MGDRERVPESTAHLLGHISRGNERRLQSTLLQGFVPADPNGTSLAVISHHDHREQHFPEILGLTDSLRDRFRGPQINDNQVRLRAGFEIALAISNPERIRALFPRSRVSPGPGVSRVAIVTAQQ